MPQFIGRPNLPNSLANSLVQLAAAESDPLAQGLRAIGGLADKATEYQVNMKMLEKKAELEEGQKQKDFERQKELKAMDRDSDIYKTLLSNDRIVSGMMGEPNMTSSDARGLLDDSGGSKLQSRVGKYDKIGRAHV